MRVLAGVSAGATGGFCSPCKQGSQTEAKLQTEVSAWRIQGGENRLSVAVLGIAAYAFVSIVWPTDYKSWGPQAFESRWYSGEKLIVQRRVTLEVSRSPFNFWSSVLPVNLGPGAAKYELYANGKKLAEKSFVVVAPAVPSAG